MRYWPAATWRRGAGAVRARTTTLSPPQWMIAMSTRTRAHRAELTVRRHRRPDLATLLG
jgi:hypothetical protein